MKKAFLFYLTFLLASSIYACSCARLDGIKIKDVESASSVFIGKAISIEDVEDGDEFGGGLKKIVFKVQKVVMNTVVAQEIVIYTSRDSAACGVYVREGETWYIFTEKYDEKQRISICGRNARIVKDRATKRTLAPSEKEMYKKNWKRFKQERRFVKKHLRQIKRAQ